MVLNILTAARRGLVTACCPSCGSHGGDLLVRFDRYFLPIDVTHCGNCGLVYTAKALSADAMRRFYTEHYPRLMGMERKSTAIQAETEGRAHARLRLERIQGAIGQLGDVLEIGCGDGYFLAECSRHAVGAVAGLEPGITRRRIAANAGIGSTILLDRMVEDLDDLPFRPQVVALFHVLEHLNNPGDVLRRLSALTDGWVVIEVPDILGDWSSLGLIFFHIGHRSYFSAHTLSALMLRSGLTPLMIEREGAEGGIYPANLRIFARPSRVLDGQPESAIGPDENTPAQVRAHLKPWSWKHGYPRAALRLGKIALSP